MSYNTRMKSKEVMVKATCKLEGCEFVAEGTVFIENDGVLDVSERTDLMFLCGDHHNDLREKEIGLSFNFVIESDRDHNHFNLAAEGYEEGTLSVSGTNRSMYNFNGSLVKIGS